MLKSAGKEYAPDDVSMTVKLLAAVAVALAFSLQAAAEDGLRRTPALEPAASAIAGKPVRVLCATSLVAWNHLVAVTFHRPEIPAGVGVPSIGAFAAAGGSTMYVGTSCADLVGLLRGKLPNPEIAGPLLLTVAHEAEHLRGVTDESEADCTALRGLAAWMITQFHVRNRRWLHVAMENAWGEHRLEPPRYRTLC